MSSLGLMPDDERTCALEQAAVVVLPYPWAARNGEVSGLTGQRWSLASLMQRMTSARLVIGGEGTEDVRAASGVPCTRFSQDERFLTENAQISAEGLLFYAMRELSKTLRGMRCMVLGFGRFGSACVEKLLALGAEATVVARSADARQAAERMGCVARDFSALREELPNAELLLNTASAPVLTAEDVRTLPETSLFLEAAGQHAWGDLACIRQAHPRTMQIGGIPGKYAPCSAAHAMLSAIERVTGAWET